MAANSTWFTVVSVFVTFVAVTGMGLMFVRGTNIERNALVGVLTFVTAAIAGAILFFSRSENMTPFGLVVVVLLSMTGFFLGRGIDRFMGGNPRSDDSRKTTLGADLSD